MTNLDKDEKDAKIPPSPQGDEPAKAGEPLEVNQELTDEENASIAAGTMRALNPQPLPP